MPAGVVPGVLLTAGCDPRQVSADRLHKYQDAIVPGTQKALDTASVSHR